MKSCSIRLELKSVIGRHIILGDLVRSEVFESGMPLWGQANLSFYGRN